MNTFFTSDTHFGHANIIRYTNRPWIEKSDVTPDGHWVSQSIAQARADEMDANLIDNWNKVVSNNDDVYHLGDFCFGNWQETANYIDALNCRTLYFIWGNHDKGMKQLSEAIKENRISIRKLRFIGDLREIKVENQGIVLCHFAMRIWNKSHFGNWNLYGHSHGALPDDSHSLSIDVGVDSHHYRPIAFSEVKAIMDKKTFKPIDHHDGI